RALANDPAVILADEPTGQLDSVHREMILTLLERLWTEGRTLIVVSHDPDIVRRAPRHVVLHDGRIKADTRIRDAASSEVYSGHPHPRTAVIRRFVRRPARPGAGSLLMRLGIRPTRPG